MRRHDVLPGSGPCVLIACTVAFWLLHPAASRAHSTIGGSLSVQQRDLRVFDNFTDPTANDNGVEDPSFPGYTGGELAIWKAAVEWGSGLHGTGQGDPHQPGNLGSGGANFDPSWQGNATSVGGINDNVHSELRGANGGVLAFCETPISNGWRIRYYSSWTWDDDPAHPVPGAVDLQGVATHEYGHALGLGHSNVVGATMSPMVSGTGVGQRSIEADDIAGLQSIYGPRSPGKPRISGVEVSVADGTITIAGSSFATRWNEVWFTQRGAGGDGTPVQVKGVSSTEGGTRIVVARPSAAGPGDVLVRVPGTGHATLSNAWPVHPDRDGCPFGAPNVTGVAPPSVPAVTAGPTSITLTGNGFAGIHTVTVGGLPLDPLAFDVLGDARMILLMPRVDRLGPVPIVVSSNLGSSPPVQVTVVAPDPPVLRLTSPFLFSASGVEATAGGTPGHLLFLVASLDLLPSVSPGVVHADIGNQFRTIHVLARTILPEQAWTQHAFQVGGLPFGTPIYLQAGVLDLVGWTLPLAMSNVATGTYYY